MVLAWSGSGVPVFFLSSWFLPLKLPTCQMEKLWDRYPRLSFFILLKESGSIARACCLVQISRGHRALAWSHAIPTRLSNSDGASEYRKILYTFIG